MKATTSTPAQDQRYESRFSQVEASFRLENMDPSGDPIYEKAKAAVLSGELTPRQALEFVVSETARLSREPASLSA